MKGVVRKNKIVFLYSYVVVSATAQKKIKRVDTHLNKSRTIGRRHSVLYVCMCVCRVQNNGI